MILDIKGITKFYGKHLALNDFSTTIRSGEIVGLIGKNGSGKTTLMNCIVNHIHTSSGTIFIDGQDLHQNKHLISNFGVLIESSFLDYLNAYENLKLLMMADGVTDHLVIEQQLQEVLELVGLRDREMEYVKNYSFGMKQRLGLAQALLNNKRLLILDEPLVGLDVMGRELVKKIIVEKAKKEDTAIIFSDHNLNEVKDVCDRIIYLEDGMKMYDGIFDDERKYAIGIEEVNDPVKLLLSTACNSVEFDGNILLVKHINDLNEILKTLVVHNITIKSFNIIEGSLIRLFKGETNNVEPKGNIQNRIEETSAP